jgi:hypothetical protein
LHYPQDVFYTQKNARSHETVIAMKFSIGFLFLFLFLFFFSFFLFIFRLLLLLLLLSQNRDCAQRINHSLLWNRHKILQTTDCSRISFLQRRKHRIVFTTVGRFSLSLSLSVSRCVWEPPVPVLEVIFNYRPCSLNYVFQIYITGLGISCFGYLKLSQFSEF